MKTNNHTETLNEENLDQVHGGSVIAAIAGSIAVGIVTNLIYDVAKNGIKSLTEKKPDRALENSTIKSTGTGASGSW